MNPRRLHLVFVVNAPSPHMSDLYRALAARGDIDVEVLSLAPADPGRGWTGNDNDYPAVAVDAGGGVEAALASRIRKNTLIVLTMYTLPQTRRAAAFLRRQDTPFVFFAEAMDARASPAKDVVRRHLFRRVVRGARGVLAVGQTGVRCYQRLVPPERVWQVAYWMRVDDFLSLPRRQTGVDDSVRFVAVGQLITRKGHDIVLRAFARVRRDHPRATLEIIGDGPERDALRTLATSLGLDTDAVLRPAVAFDRRASLFARADVLVLATRHDGWGMVVPEAMASGLAVVSTPTCGAAVDLVRDGIDGRIVATEDDLALAMAEYARDPSLACGHGDSGRQRLQQVWSPEIGASRLVEILSPLLP